MEQTSRLSIVVDTRNAETKIRSFNTNLKQMERNGETVARAIAKVGNNVNFGRLNSGIAGAQQSLKAFTNTANTTATAINKLSQAANGLRAATSGIANNLRIAASSMASINNVAGGLNNARGAANGLNTSTRAVSASLVAMNASLNASRTALGQFSQAAITANQRLSAFGQAATQSQTRLRGLDTGLVTARNNMAQMAQATNNMNTFFASLNGQMARLATVTNRLNDATIRANAAYNQLGGGLNNANSHARGLMGTLQGLQGVLMGSLGSLAGFGILKTADEMQNLNSQIKNVTDSEREYLGVKQQLKVIADQNYSDISATTGLYTNSARALANLGKSQQDALEFTNAVSFAMRTGGKSASEQASAIMQLGQAMGANVVQGDEFRSIAENAPILLELVAKRLGVLPGQLKELASEGKITGEVMFDAMTQNVDILEDMAKKMPLTMSQAFQVAKNNYKKHVDDMMNQTGGMSSKIADAISGISANFDTMAKVSIAGIGLAFLSVITNINLATKAMAIFNAVTSANPLLLVAAGFLAVTSAIYGTNEVLTLSGVMIGDLITMIGDTAKYVGGIFNDMSDWILENVFRVEKAVHESNDRNEKSYFGFYKNTETGFAGLTQRIMANVASVGALTASMLTYYQTFVDNLVISVNNLMTAFSNLYKMGLNLFGGDNKLGEFQDLKVMDIVQIYRAENSSNQDVIADYVRGANQRAGLADPTYKNALRSPVFNGNVTFNSLMTPGSGVLKPSAKGVPSNLLAPIGQISNDAMSAEKSLQFATMKLMEEREATAKAMEKARKEREKAERKVNGGSKPKDQLVGISGNTGIGTAAHLDIRYADGKGKVRPEHLARFKADGKPLSAYPVTSGYGARKAPVKGASTFHPGIDYGMKSGTPITTSVPVKSVKTYASGNGAGNISHITFADGVAIKLLHQAPAALKIKNGSRTGNSEYDSAINAQINDEQKAAEEAVKIAQRKYEEMMALRRKLQDEYGTEKAKLLQQHTDRVDEINESNFDSGSKIDMIKQSEKRMNSELAVYTEGLNRQLSALSAFKKTEREIIEENRKNEKFDAANNKELIRPENEAILKQVLEGIDRKYDHELLVYENTLRKQSSELTAYQKTERQIMLDGWNDKIADASFATDELAQLRIDSLYAQRDKETELFDINQDLKMLELKKSHMTEMQYIREKYALEQYLIDSSNETPEFKAQQTINNKDGFMKAGQEVQDRVGGAYDAQSRGLYGQSNAYNELKTAWEAQLEIAKAAYDEGYIQKEEYYERLESLDRNYLNNQNALMLSGYASTFGDAAGLLKAFGQEQSFAYKAMFAAQKAFSLASVIMSGYEAISKAYASAPFPYNVIPVAKALQSTGVIQAAISAISPQGFKTGGYTGTMGVNDVAGVVHGQEYVFDAQATKRIGVDNLNAMRRGDAPKGGGDVIINNYSSAKIEQRQDANGVTILEVRDEIQKSWNQLQNPNSHPSKMVNRNVQAPRRR